MSFNRLQPEDFLISADSVTAGAWTGNVPTLTEFYTSSVQEAATSGQYFLNVYQTESANTDAEVQFAIAYGNAAGSGSLLFDSNIDGRSPSSVVYGQFQNIILGDESTAFTYGSTTPATQHFYAISVNRARYKGGILPGSLTLKLASGFAITDDSATTNTVSFNEAGRVFNLRSGSAGTVDDTDPVYYGLFLPDIGTLLLDAEALDTKISLSTNKNTNVNGENPQKLFDKIVAQAQFTLNSEEKVTSDYVFIRARNSEFNYSENPSFITGSTGEVYYSDFINAPQTFITTVGLYNDTNDLLAVAKLSKPLKKDFTKEALVRVKLDF